MFYWLFTEGRTILSLLVCPLACLSVFVPLGVATWLGVGIQRRAEGTPLQTRGWLSVGRWLSFLVPNLGMIAVYVTLLGNTAIARPTERQVPLKGFLAALVGGPAYINQPRLLMMGFGLCCLLFFLNATLWQGLRNGGWLREWIDRLRRPSNLRGEMGSAHFCTRREYVRYRRHDPNGVTFLGAFWGEKHLRLDTGWGMFCLSAEDVARGILTIGGPGSGKSQGVVLPVIADRMMAGHSLIVADPQGELTEHILKFAKVTRHLVVVHDPTSKRGPRFNLAQGIDNVSDAKSIATVLIPSMNGDNKFWSDSASDLLSACLIRFDNLGDIKSALDDLQSLAEKLSSKKDDATLLANAFIASVGSDGKIASNVVATLGTALTGWASADVRANTQTCDFDADLIVTQPTIVVLTCPGRMRGVYAPYLGATLRKLMLDLDTIGERNGGPLPAPVGIILDEFPTLGKLDSLVADVNLVRKRRISILIGAQTKGQFHMIYGADGTQSLFTGLATQIIYGGCDPDTAKFYSEASGMATVDANPEPTKANLRQRSLLTPDEIINPADGNCTLFARFVDSNFAAQIILCAQLTRLYEREDWKERLRKAARHEPFKLERGIPMNVAETRASPLAPESASSKATISVTPDDPFAVGESDLAIVEQMQAAAEQTQSQQAGIHQLPMSHSKPTNDDKLNEASLLQRAGVQTTSVTAMKEKHLKKVGASRF